MCLQVGVLFVGIGEFSRFRTSWHTIGTLCGPNQLALT
jgi:hypothetical protein